MVWRSRDGRRRAGRLACLVGVALTVLATACSSGTSGTGGAGGAGRGQLGGATKGELLVWDWDDAQPGFAQAFKQIDADFTAQHPGVTIRRVVQPFPNYAQLVQATFTAQSGPCVAEFLVGGSGILRFKDGLVPLNGVITSDQQGNLLGMDVVADGYRTGNKVYGLPFGLQPQVMYYDKSLFQRAGLDPSKPPRTYDELVADAKALKAAGIVPFGGGNKEGFLSEWWFSFLWPGAATVKQSYDLALGRMKFTDPLVQQTVTRYIDLVKQGYFPPGLESTPMVPTAADDFAAGKSAMFVGLGSGGFASYVPFDKSLGVDNVGVIEAVGTGSGKANFLPGGPASSWGIPQYCKMKQLAYDYINAVTGPAGQKTLWDVGGVIPGTRAVPAPAQAPPQVTQMIADFRASSSLYPPHGLWPSSVDTTYTKEMQLVIGGQESIGQALGNVESAQTAG
jgi:ABC-type glycerol-3-phosphate transport system substrate-binding protein